VQYFDIIIFAVLAGYLGIKLYRTLGTKTKIENKTKEINNKKTTSANIINKKETVKTVQSGEGLEYLKSLYKNFNDEEFLSGANKAFELIIKARNEGNKKSLISLLEDNAYRVFEKEILEKEIKGNNIKSTKIEIINSKITNVKVDNNIAYISIFLI